MISYIPNASAAVDRPFAGRRDRDLVKINRRLEGMSAEERVNWAFGRLPGKLVLSSSFGIQSAVMLHLVTRVRPDIPVVLVDTGYLFEQTYQFVDALKDRLGLNLQVYRADLSPAWQEARYGQLWRQGQDGLQRYNQINKVEPFKRALDDQNADGWFAGLRRQQAESRGDLPVLRMQDGRFKIHPIIDWSDRDVHRYLGEFDLPYHPLWEEGYVSVGDHHSSLPLGAGMRAEDTRFFGLKRECGLHD